MVDFVARRFRVSDEITWRELEKDPDGVLIIGAAYSRPSRQISIVKGEKTPVPSRSYSAVMKASTVAVPMLIPPLNASVPKIWFKVAAAPASSFTVMPLR
jgi:hypothetical protein